MQESVNKSDVCILIPTYNRNDAVDYYLKKKLDYFRSIKFDVVIYDSSRNDLTKNVVEKYIRQGYSCLKYVHYKDPEDDLYGNTKVRDALLKCADDYEYVWLCGDTAILLLDEYEDQVFDLLEKKYDVIHIYKNELGLSSEVDLDYRLFFKNFFWSMTHWCAFILSRRLIKDMEKWMTECLEMKNTGVIVYAVFKALAYGNYKIAYINHGVYKHSPCRGLAAAMKNKEMLKGFAEMINVCVDCLPGEYDEVKNIAKKSFTENTGTFSWQGAIDLRAGGSLSVKKLIRYKKHLRNMTDVPMAWFYLWSIVPKSVARKISPQYLAPIKEERKLNKLNKNASRVIIYGAGEHGVRILYKIGHDYDNIKIVAVSDKNSDRDWLKMNWEHGVIPLADIPKYDYDSIAVTILNKKVYKEVRKQLMQAGAPAGSIFHI